MGEKTGFKISAMNKADLDQVLAIERVSFSTAWTKPLFLRELNNPAVSTLLVAYADPEPSSPKPDQRAILGYIIFWVLVDEMHILNLATHPKFRQRGIAKQLVLTALEQAYRNGARTAFLEVRASNAAAQKLYSDIGFTGIGSRRAYYDNPREDAVIMRLPEGAYATLVHNSGILKKI